MSFYWSPVSYLQASYPLCGWLTVVCPLQGMKDFIFIFKFNITLTQELFFIGLVYYYQVKNIMFRFIIEYSSLRELLIGPYGVVCLDSL